jgi:hypothetical protein
MHISPCTIGAAVLVISLAACAGRSPQPVAVVQPQDRFMDCAAISAEAQANNVKVQQLGGEQGDKVAQNVAAGVAGLFIWPLWFAMDFQGSADKEVSALQSRQQYLTTMAEQRRCGGPAAPQSVAPVYPQPMTQPAPPAFYPAGQR